MGNDVIFERIVKFTADISALKKELEGSFSDTPVLESLFRAAAGVGVNFSDAMYPLGKNDFVVKLQLALKKASETEYWLRFLQKTTESGSIGPLLKECGELKKIFSVSVANAGKQNSKPREGSAAGEGFLA